MHYLLCVLVSSDKQLYDAWDGSVFSEWGMIGWTKSQVADEPNHCLDEWPAARRVQKFDQHWQTVV